MNYSLHSLVRLHPHRRCVAGHRAGRPRKRDRRKGRLLWKRGAASLRAWEIVRYVTQNCPPISLTFDSAVARDVAPNICTKLFCKFTKKDQIVSERLQSSSHREIPEIRQKFKTIINFSLKSQNLQSSSQFSKLALHVRITVRTF